MALIQWSDDLSVKVSLFDNHHKKLFSLINDLHEGMRTGKGRYLIGMLLGNFVDYAGYHFSVEEQQLKATNYADLDYHKAQHEDFIRKMRDFKKFYDEGGLSISMEVVCFIRDWLVEHVKETDKKYSRHFTEAK